MQTHFRNTILFVVLLSFFDTLSVHAQTENDTTRIRFRNRQLILIDKHRSSDDETPRNLLNRVEAHWAGVEFGTTILLNKNFSNSFEQDKHWENDPAKSFSWNFNFLEYKFKLYENYVGLTTGLGVNWTQIGFKNNLLIQNSQDSIWSFKDTLIDYKRNKLVGTYLTIPVLFEFCTKKLSNKGFFFAVGVIGGLKVASTRKMVYSANNDNIRIKNTSSFGLNPFTLDAAFKVGYRNIGFFANYSLLPRFDKRKTVGVFPLVIGVSLHI